VNKTSKTTNALFVNDIIPTDSLPSDAKLSDDIKKRSKYFIRVQYLGKSYYIPITKETRKIFQLKINKKSIKIAFSQKQRVETLLRDIIASIYLQTRDTVGTEIYRELSIEIKNGLENMFQERLFANIENKFNQKQIMHHT